jgi:hypothetical protein
MAEWIKRETRKGFKIEIALTRVTMNLFPFAKYIS